MVRLFLSASTGNIGQNISLGKALLADVVPFRKALDRSIAACTVRTAGGGAYLPVFAVTNSTPLVNMHEGRDASYRFLVDYLLVCWLSVCGMFPLSLTEFSTIPHKHRCTVIACA